MPFLMIRNDITKVHADVIVNPANTDLLEGSGTSRAIYEAAGEEALTKVCRKIGSCKFGEAVITPGFHLPAKYIIHAAGPVWMGGKHGEAELLYRAYWNSMKLAAEYHLESIAFPLLSSGNYGYPKDKALKVAVHAISDFLMEEEMLVYLVLYDRNALAVSKKLFASVEEYIDDHYVEEKDEEYLDEASFPEHQLRRRLGSHANIDVSGFVVDEVQEMASLQEAFMPLPMAPSGKSAPVRSLEQLVNLQNETFSQMLLRLIDERGLKDSYVYKKANVDRRHFSKIRNDVDYAPNKKTVLAFAIALELSMDETRDLLMRAGFAFSCCSKFDVIICYFIENGMYDIFGINEMLFAYGQPTLGE